MCIDFFFQQRELAIAREALKEKRRREAALLKEKSGMLNDRDVGEYVEQAQQVAKRMIAKKAVKNYDWGKCVYDPMGYIGSNVICSGGKEGTGCYLGSNE